MAEFDPRIVRVSIEIRGQLRVYDGLAITATGEKFANANQNETTVKIANLAKDVRDYLATECSPFNANRTRKKLILEVGRRSYGTFVLYAGDITSVTVGQPPDVWVELKCLTGDFDKGNIVSRSQPGKALLSVIAQQVANDLSLALAFEATDKQISSYSFTGGALKQVEKLASAGMVNAYVDDGRLIVKNQNQPMVGAVRMLDIDSGMIGKPEFTEHGVKVKFLIDNLTQLGGRLVIKSITEPSANGTFEIYKLSFDVASRDVPFYYIAEAKRLGAE